MVLRDSNSGFVSNDLISESESMLMISLSCLVLRLLESGISCLVGCSEIDLSHSSSDIVVIISLSRVYYLRGKSDSGMRMLLGDSACSRSGLLALLDP